jgi:hypothetical protein
MKVITKWLPLLAALTVGTIASAASPKMTWTLTGKEVKTCCCKKTEQRKIAVQAHWQDTRQVLLQRDVTTDEVKGGEKEWQRREKSKSLRLVARFVKTHCSW